MRAFLALCAAAICGGSSDARAHVPHDIVVDLKLSPRFEHDRRLFATVRESVFRSEDGGASWDRCSLGLCLHAPERLALSPAFERDRVVFVTCVQGELHASQDAGRSWHRRWSVEPDARILALGISPDFGLDCTLLAVTGAKLAARGGALQRSTDGGASWRPAFPRGPRVHALAWEGELAVVATQGGELRSSADAGASWSVLARIPADQRVTHLALPPGYGAEEPLFYATAAGEIHRVAPASGSVEPIEGRLTDPRVTALAARRTEGGFALYATTWADALHRSTDGGRSWTRCARGLATTPQADRSRKPHWSVIERSGSTAFLGGFSGLFRSDDDGRSWFKVDVSLHHLVGIDLAPLDDGELALAFSTYGGGAHTSRDEGRSWIIGGNPRLGPIAFSPDFAADGVVFAGSFGGLLRSSDGGSSWSRASARSLQRFGDLAAWIAVSPDFARDETVFVALRDHDLFRSRDGGRTLSLVWDTSGERIRGLAISPNFAADATLFACLGSGLHRSTDAGESWTRLPHEQDLWDARLAVSPDFAQDRTLFAASRSGLFCTRDAGATWEELELGQPGRAAPISQIAISPSFATDRLLLVQVRRGHLYRCYDREEGFAVEPLAPVIAGIELSHWISKEGGSLLRFSPHFARDQSVYAASGQRLFVSRDGARSWRAIPRLARYEAEAALRSSLFFPIELSGDWSRDAGGELSGGAALSSRRAQSGLTLHFSGSGVAWIGARGPAGGRARVLLDGELRTTVDLAAPEPVTRARCFEAADLGPGFHALTIEVDGGDSQAEGGVVWIDALDVRR